MGWFDFLAKKTGAAEPPADFARIEEIIAVSVWASTNRLLPGAIEDCASAAVEVASDFRTLLEQASKQRQPDSANLQKLAAVCFLSVLRFGAEAMLQARRESPAAPAPIL